MDECGYMHVNKRFRILLGLSFQPVGRRLRATALKSSSGWVSKRVGWNAFCLLLS